MVMLILPGNADNKDEYQVSSADCTVVRLPACNAAFHIAHYLSDKRSKVKIRDLTEIMHEMRDV